MGKFWVYNVSSPSVNPRGLLEAAGVFWCPPPQKGQTAWPNTAGLSPTIGDLVILVRPDFRKSREYTGPFSVIGIGMISQPLSGSVQHPILDRGDDEIIDEMNKARYRRGPNGGPCDKETTYVRLGARLVMHSEQGNWGFDFGVVTKPGWHPHQKVDMPPVSG